MRILILDTDRVCAAHLAKLLEQRGHCVTCTIEETHPPDAMIVALPAPLAISPEKLQDVPLLLLVDGMLPFGELESWIESRRRWALLSKPLREESLDRSLDRITRPRSDAPSDVPGTEPRR